jgi:hypothetical protein
MLTKHCTLLLHIYHYQEQPALAVPTDEGYSGASQVAPSFRAEPSSSSSTFLHSNSITPVVEHQQQQEKNEWSVQSHTPAHSPTGSHTHSVVSPNHQSLLRNNSDATTAMASGANSARESRKGSAASNSSSSSDSSGDSSTNAYTNSYVVGCAFAIDLPAAAQQFSGSPVCALPTTSSSCSPPQQHWQPVVQADGVCDTTQHHAVSYHASNTTSAADESKILAKIACRYHFNGGCRNGKSCQNRHGPPESVPVTDGALPRSTSAASPATPFSSSSTVSQPVWQCEQQYGQQQQQQQQGGYEHEYQQGYQQGYNHQQAQYMTPAMAAMPHMHAQWAANNGMLHNGLVAPPQPLGMLMPPPPQLPVSFPAYGHSDNNNFNRHVNQLPFVPNTNYSGMPLQPALPQTFPPAVAAAAAASQLAVAGGQQPYPYGVHYTNTNSFEQQQTFQSYHHSSSNTSQHARQCYPNTGY